MSQPAARRTSGETLSVSRVAAGSDALLQVYTIAEAACLLRVPEGWLRKKVTAGAVPHTRLGKHVRFTVDHLRRIVAAGEEQPAAMPGDNGQGLSPHARRAGRAGR